jgi:hypothetical protein
MARTCHLPNLALVVAWVTSRLVTRELRKVLEADPPRISFPIESSPTDSEPMAVPFRSRPCRLRDSALWAVWESELLLVCSRLHSEIRDTHGRCC